MRGRGRAGGRDFSFNPYRVFKFVATSVPTVQGSSGDTVSIPIGFSSSLQPSTRYTPSFPPKRFQSLSGFQVRCNFQDRNTMLDNGEFQSLSGFQVRCNVMESERPESRSGFNPYRVFKFVATRLPAPGRLMDTFSFQSLSGFQVRCNAIDRGMRFLAWSVSIPIGFSSSLQPTLIDRTGAISIGFQSLSGFQVRCNQSGPVEFEKNISQFQSLSGFQVRCNYGGGHVGEEEEIRFQSLSGFQVRCNSSAAVRVIDHRTVSIPIGFSSSLQRIYS